MKLKLTLIREIELDDEEDKQLIDELLKEDAQAIYEVFVGDLATLTNITYTNVKASVEQIN